MWKADTKECEILDIKNVEITKPESASDKEMPKSARKVSDSSFCKNGGMERLVSVNWVNGSVLRQVRKSSGVK